MESQEATRLLGLAIDNLARAIAALKRAGRPDIAAPFQVHLVNIAQGHLTEAEFARLQNHAAYTNLPPPPKGQQGNISFVERELMYVILRLEAVAEKSVDEETRTQAVRQAVELRAEVAKYTIDDADGQSESQATGTDGNEDDWCFVDTEEQPRRM
ncbi:hypothetical protein LTR36_010883 [Oleoguttula mirabilis]|uniref:Uncharacterized protein n=1 Tax=Oleoguttula mirabilis TaxID=1507867 RepID=A0AAV9J3W3_9PEZI|nr:hypothetical protein LTR36_010883 [Oleoguttula mirabilis]